MLCHILEQRGAMNDSRSYCALERIASLMNDNPINKQIAIGRDPVYWKKKTKDLL